MSGWGFVRDAISGTGAYTTSLSATLGLSAPSGSSSSSSGYVNPFNVAPIAATFQTDFYRAARAGLTDFAPGGQMAFNQLTSLPGYPSPVQAPFGGGGFWGGVGEFLGGLLPGLTGQPFTGPMLPGDTSIDLPGADLWPGDPMANALWTRGASGYRQTSTLVVPSPDGRIGFWKAMGRPVLFSGDLAACRRVNKIAARVGRVARRRGGRRGGR